MLLNVGCMFLQKHTLKIRKLLKSGKILILCKKLIERGKKLNLLGVAIVL